MCMHMGYWVIGLHWDAGHGLHVEDIPGALGLAWHDLNDLDTRDNDCVECIPD